MSRGSEATVGVHLCTLEKRSGRQLADLESFSDGSAGVRRPLNQRRPAQRGRWSLVDPDGNRYPWYLDLARQTNARPVPAAVPISDMAVGQQAALRIASAIVAVRETGRGRHLDVCSFDVLWRWSRAFGAPEYPSGDPRRRGMLFANAWPCYQCLESSDGVWFASAPIERPFWDRFCALLGRPDLREHGYDEAFVPEVHAEFARRTAAELRSLFEGHEICVVELMDFGSAMKSPHAVARGLEKGRGPVPALGQDTNALLREIGLPAERVALLRRGGVVGR